MNALKKGDGLTPETRAGPIGRQQAHGACPRALPQAAARNARRPRASAHTAVALRAVHQSDECSRGVQAEWNQRHPLPPSAGDRNIQDRSGSSHQRRPPCEGERGDRAPVVGRPHGGDPDRGFRDSGSMPNPCSTGGEPTASTACGSASCCWGAASRWNPHPGSARASPRNCP